MTMTTTSPIGPLRSKQKIFEGYDPVAGTWSDPENQGFTVPKLLASLRTGASPHSCAQFAKVSWNTIRRWQEAGRMVANDPDLMDRMQLEPDDRVFVDFALAMEFVSGSVEVELSTLVRAGCREDPKLALAVLARRYPWWREQKQLDVTSGGVSLVQDRIAGLLNADPKLANAAEVFALALEDAAGDGTLDDEE